MAHYRNARFVASYAQAAQLPPSIAPEFSFVGRSNVGKSSIMNRIFERKGLVKVSSTPGKTQAINLFEAGGATFVDLPGYGYAKRSKSERESWRPLIEGYFGQERDFGMVFALVDIRHDASALDVQMIEFLAQRGLPYCICFTKADKLSNAQQQRQVRALCKQLAATGDAIVLVTSSANGQGVDDVRALIGEVLAG